MPVQNEKLGLIAGNGKFPFLVLDAARAQGYDVVVAAMVGEDEGIRLEKSTWLLEPLLVKSGVLTEREPSEQERKNIEYGRAVARRLAEHDIGQTVVIAESACVAVEAME